MRKLILFLMLLFIPGVCLAVSGYPNRGTVLNQTLTTSGTEYQVNLPIGTSNFVAQSRTAADFKLSYAVGTSGSTYFTVKSGTVYNSPTLMMGTVTPNTTLYLQSATGGQVVEVMYFQ